MIIISMKTSAQCSAAIKSKIIRRKAESEGEEITVQLSISVVFPGLEPHVQVWSSSLSQDTGQGSGRDDEDDQKHGKASKHRTTEHAGTP